MRLIDGDKLEKTIKEELIDGYNDCIDAVRDAPTVDVNKIDEIHNMLVNETIESFKRLAKEYVSKCNCCDECFAEIFCTLNGRRESRVPCKDTMKCVFTISDYLKSL